MENVLLVIHMMIAVALIIVILMQRSAQDGGGLMGGGSTMGGLFTARGSANLLTRTTAFLATAFMISSLVLGIMAGNRHGTASLVDQVAASQKKEEPKAEKAGEDPKAPALPQVPVSK